MARNSNSPFGAFPGACVEDDTDVESARTLSEPDQDFLERTLLTAATDQNSRESGSSLPERLPAKEQPCQRPNNPQTATPALYVPWQEVAQHMGIPVVHEEVTADLRTMFQHAIVNKESFIDCKALPSAESLSRLHRSKTIASIILDSMTMYEVHPWAPHWEIMLWHMAQSCKFWLTAPTVPPPSRIQINCGGLGGGALDSPTAPLHAPKSEWGLHLRPLLGTGGSLWRAMHRGSCRPYR